MSGEVNFTKLAKSQMPEGRAPLVIYYSNIAV